MTNPVNVSKCLFLSRRNFFNIIQIVQPTVKSSMPLFWCIVCIVLCKQICILTLCLPCNVEFFASYDIDRYKIRKKPYIKWFYWLFEVFGESIHFENSIDQYEARAIMSQFEDLFVLQTMLQSYHKKSFISLETQAENDLVQIVTFFIINCWLSMLLYSCRLRGI